MNQYNQNQIAAARKEISGFRSDTGKSYRNNTGSSFYPQNWEQDMGSQVYHDPGRTNVAVSKPNVLNIQQAEAGLQTVNIGGAFANFAAANFGNAVNVTITYTSNNPLVPFTYGQFLGTTIGSPLHVGLIRIQTVTQAQATATLSVLRNVGVGSFDGDSMFPVIYPNQLITNVTYVEDAFKLDGFTTLSYLQNGTTDQFIQLWLYASATVNLDRAFSNQKVVQEYGRPQTGIATTIQQPAAAQPSLMRSKGLL